MRMSSRWRRPFFVRAVDVPAAGHEHVGEEDEVAGEINEDPFAVGFDFFDSATGDGSVYFDAFEFGKDAFEGGDGLVGERAMERACGTKDCVAFGHLAGLREIVVGVGVVGGIFCIAAGNHGGDSTHLVAEGAGGEAGFFEEAGEEMFARGLVVDVADEEAGAAALAADGEFGEFFGEFAGELGALGFVFGEEDSDGGIAAAKEGGEDAVDEDDAGAFCAGHGVRAGGGVLGFCGGGFRRALRLRLVGIVCFVNRLIGFAFAIFAARPREAACRRDLRDRWRQGKLFRAWVGSVRRLRSMSTAEVAAN